VTSQPQPGPGEGKTAGQYLRPLRDLAAYALVGAVAVLLFVAIIRLIPSGPYQFAARTRDSFYNFVNLETVFFPLGAVLLALLVHPRHPKAQLIVIVAVVEYAAAAFFGVLFGVLFGLINQASDNGARIAFEEFLVRLAWLAVFAVAAFAVFQIWRNMFTTPRPPKPQPQPGMYGQPQYNAPGAYPGQPGYGPPPGAGPPPGSAYPQQPYPGQPQAYGQPAPTPPWNQPPVAMPPAGPPAAPVSGVPTSAPVAPPPGPFAPHPGHPPAAFGEPTQIVPPATDRTQRIGDDRPGYGPADPDQPRQ
jgi:hypothetical protein